MSATDPCVEASDDPAAETRPLGGDADAVTQTRIAAGTVVGRYVVVDPLGAGAMGVVVRAYDPKLHREVALKLVRPIAATQEARSRMVREAQALASLAHPNVVAVYDVEDTAYGLCIALEYVQGQDLAAWLAERRRPWPEVLEVMRATARGLAAAHAAGLVHRDVKPANILVGSDGRVRVSDFGLARGGTATTTSGQGSAPEAPLGDEGLTEVGTVMGTPAYMPPEQHEGRRTDARADVYALCVTAWECLYGARPFVAESMPALVARKCEPAPAPPRRDVPRWVYTTLVRGLAPDPDDRWPTVEAFVAALDRGQRGRRRRASAYGIGALLAAAAAVGGVHQLQRASVRADCEARGRSIDAIWSEPRRAALREGLRATDSALATTVDDKVRPWLDAHAAAWTAAATDACRAAELDGTWNAATAERADWCLDERRLQLGALVDRLIEDPEAALTKAVEAAATLDPIEPCTDPVLLARLQLPTAAQRTGAETVRAEIARATALQTTGSYAEGRAAAQVALEHAEAVGWTPLTAAARHRLGALVALAAKPGDAEPLLEDAYFEAARSGSAERAFEAAQDLAFCVGIRLARHDEGLRWSRLAEVALSDLPDPAGLRRASQRSYVAYIREAQGEYPQALALQQEALALREAALGASHPRVAATLQDLGNVRHRMGAYDEAESLLRRALEIRQATLGADHPEVASTLSHLAGTIHAKGDDEGARRAYTQALTVRERVFGPDHPQVAHLLGNLASVDWSLEDFDRAQRRYERAIAILERALGPDHPDVAVSVYGLGTVLQAQGRLDEARPHHLRALGIRERVHGPDHPEVARIVSNLGHLELESGDHEQARRYYERALAIREATLGPDHPHVAYTLVGLGELALRRGDGTTAAEHARRALALREAAGSGPSEVAQARFLLAQAIDLASPRRRAEAIALAQAAAEAFDAHGDFNPGDLAVARDWLSQRSAAP